MQVRSINIGTPEPIQRGNREVLTAIRKTPVSKPVFVGELGLQGDHQVATKHHGGPDQAIYVYSEEDYAWWAGDLGQPLGPGTFGENLTLTEFGAPELYIGDRWQIGDVLLEITAPRFPCATLAARMGDAEFVKKFKQVERPGAYTRVLQHGHAQVGDPVMYQRGKSDVTLLECFRLHYEKAPSRDAIAHILQAPIAVRGRRAYEAMLEA